VGRGWGARSKRGEKGRKRGRKGKRRGNGLRGTNRRKGEERRGGRVGGRGENEKYVLYMITFLPSFLPHHCLSLGHSSV
jgi:hypothetical protein